VSEERSSRGVVWVTAAVLLLLVASRFVPKLGNPLAPEPTAAYVAALATGESVATDGVRELAAGKEFRLFAVLEARDWRGGSIWYSEAPALRLGGRDVPAAALRRPPDDPLIKVRWFTVEGSTPYLEVRDAADLTRFRVDDEFHPEWGSGWTVRGIVDPKLVFLEDDSPLRPLPFGTQRYAVRIEKFADSKALTPANRTSSPAAELAVEQPDRVTAVVAALPPPLDVLSAAFGRKEIEPAPDLGPTLGERIDRLAAIRLAFERARLLRRHLESNSTPPESLVWRQIDLERTILAWGRDVSAGDLLQAGPRVVVLYRDQAEAGRLDSGDLVFDLWKGLHVRRIDQVFRSDGDFELQLARLRRPAAPESG